jgi:hemoglobin
LLTLQVCEATGGPCTYIGKDMVASHEGMNITEEQFNITGEYLQAALQKFNVPEKEQNELLTAIGAMGPDIIGK